MINPQWLELPMSRMNFHGPKDVRAIEVRLYKYDELVSRFSVLGKFICKKKKKKKKKKKNEIVFLFSQKTFFDISCKLSRKETICVERQILFSGENKKNIL